MMKHNAVDEQWPFKDWVKNTEIRHITPPPPKSKVLSKLQALGGSSCEDELQGSLDVPTSGLQCSEAQFIIMNAHISQLLELWLPLTL